MARSILRCMRNTFPPHQDVQRIKRNRESKSGKKDQKEEKIHCRRPSISIKVVSGESGPAKRERRLLWPRSPCFSFSREVKRFPKRIPSNWVIHWVIRTLARIRLEVATYVYNNGTISSSQAFRRAASPVEILPLCHIEMIIPLWSWKLDGLGFHLVRALHPLSSTVWGRNLKKTLQTLNSSAIQSIRYIMHGQPELHKNQPEPWKS